MIVGVLRVVLALPYNDSLKGKRSVIKSILERARGRFHVSASEVADHDAHRRAVLGFAYVTNDSQVARSVLDKVTSFVAGASEAQVLDAQSSLEHIEFAGLRVPSLGEDRWHPPGADDLGEVEARGSAREQEDDDGHDEER